jgi:hypothetical protein
VTTSSGTSIHTQVRLTGGLPVRFARRGAPASGEPVPAPASTSTAGRTARPWLNVDDAWCEALFASALQRSAAPEAARVAGSPVTTADQRNQHGRNETQCGRSRSSGARRVARTANRRVRNTTIRPSAGPGRPPHAPHGRRDN